MIKTPRSLLERVADYLRLQLNRCDGDDFWAADILAQVEYLLERDNRLGRR